MSKYDIYFTKAKEAGIEALELSIYKSKKFSFGLFRNEIDSYNIADSIVLVARGLYNGKFGYATSEKIDKNTPDYIIKHIKENASLITNSDKQFIFKGSEKYHKKNIFNKKLSLLSNEEKIKRIKDIDKKVKDSHPYIREVESGYEEVEEETLMLNSYGLKLNHKTNYALIYSSAVATNEKEETKNGYEYKLLEDFDSFDVKEFVEKVKEKTISQFGSEPCASQNYKTVLSSDAFSSLLGAYLSNLSSEEVQKNTSLLKGKLNEKVASKKLTVYEKPLKKNVFFRYFDDEGVATQDKTLIKNGILQTYLYNLATAYKDNVTSTGNGYKGGGGKISISMVNIEVKKGKLSEEELFKKVNDGIYITEISGLHAGLNSQSGNFSLLSQGFMIKNGKKDKPVSLITIAGNLFDLFNDIEEVGNNLEQHLNSFLVPSVIIKSLAISGK